MATTATSIEFSGADTDPISASSESAATATTKASSGNGGFGDNGSDSGDNNSGSGNAAPKSRIVDFVHPVLKPKERIFIAEYNHTLTFTYQYDDSLIELETLHWKRQQEADPKSSFVSIANTSFVATGRDNGVPPNDLLSQVGLNSATLNLNDLPSADYGTVMRIELDWVHKKSDTNGKSYSGLFSSTKLNSDPSGSIEQDMEQAVNSDSRLEQGYDDPADLDSISASGTSTRVTASPTSSNAAEKGASKGGLSTGAKAGIAVGTILGALLIIGFLALFLVRRRRQSKDGKGLGGHQSSGTYMVDKETHGRTTDSPNSPYSDENQTRHVNLEDLDTTRKGPSVHAEQPGFTPYDDVPARPSMSGSRGLGENTGAQTPTQVSSNVAHLVEDGMTREEIERLEEEERQLDAEIERAARR